MLKTAAGADFSLFSRSTVQILKLFLNIKIQSEKLSLIARKLLKQVISYIPKLFR